MVQLPEVHPRLRPTKRSPRAQNPDAKSRGTRDNAVRLRHVEAARVPLRHAVPSPPQLPDSLHRLAKQQSRRPPKFLSGHAYQDGKRKHRGDHTQEADVVRRICDAHGEYETAEVRDVRRSGGGRGSRGGPGKRMDGVFPERPQECSVSTPTSGRLQPRTRGNGARRRTRNGIFHGEMDRCRESRAGLRHALALAQALACPNGTGQDSLFGLVRSP